MRFISLSIGAIAAAVLIAQAGMSGAALAADAAPKLDHPGEVALFQSEAGYAYRAFPSNLALYVLDEDKDGIPTCNRGCELAWPPVIAPDTAKPTGDWTLVTRFDGKKQWRYKNRPVYILFHDDPEKPMGDNVEQKWHILKP